MAIKRQAIDNKRRIPRQMRAEETVAAILEGAAQILEAGGLAAFTTNAVAARAGVSIGTLYQYFGDKHAVLAAAARRELGRAPTLPKRQRALVEALIAMVETLGRLGTGGTGAAPAGLRAAGRPPAQPKRRREAGWKRRCADLAREALALLAPPEPALRPIPVRLRGHPDGPWVFIR